MEKPDLKPPRCESTGRPADLVPFPFRVRRGERTLSVTGWIWNCPDCRDPMDGSSPWEFTDPAVGQVNQLIAEQSWQETFGEPLPPSARGRKNRPLRLVRVPVLMTEDEARRLDDIRGDLTRSEFLRRSVDPVRKVG